MYNILRSNNWATHILKTVILQARENYWVKIWFFYNKSWKNLSILDQLTKGFKNQTQKIKSRESFVPRISQWKASFCKLKPYFEISTWQKQASIDTKATFPRLLARPFYANCLSARGGFQPHINTARVPLKKRGKKKIIGTLKNSYFATRNKKKTLFIGRKITNANSLLGITPAAFAFSACR